MTKTAHPILPLRDIVIFPHMIAPLFVGRIKSINAIEAVMEENKQIVLLTQKKPSIEDPKEKDLYKVVSCPIYNIFGDLGSNSKLLDSPIIYEAFGLNCIEKENDNKLGDNEQCEDLMVTMFNSDVQQEDDEHEQHQHQHLDQTHIIHQ